MNIILTGGTGNLGFIFLYQILKNKNFNNIFLCTFQNKNVYLEKLKYLQNYYNIKLVNLDKIKIYRISKLNSTSINHFKRFLNINNIDKIDYIFHFAAHTNLNKKFNEIKNININYTKFLLRIAELFNSKFIYTSSIFIASKKIKYLKNKFYFNLNKDDFYSSYEYSKYLNELIIYKHYKLKNINFLIYRIGILTEFKNKIHNKNLFQYFIKFNKLYNLSKYSNKLPIYYISLNNATKFIIKTFAIYNNEIINTCYKHKLKLNEFNFNYNNKQKSIILDKILSKFNVYLKRLPVVDNYKYINYLK